MVLKALNTLLNFKLYLIYTILILFWELNQNSIQIFHHIQSSCLHIQSSEEIETHSAEAIKSDLASIEEPNFNVDGCEALWSSLKLQIGRHNTSRPFIDHQTLPLRYLTI